MSGCKHEGICAVLQEETTDLRPVNAAAEPYRYDVSPEYFQAAGTTLLAGRDLSWHDDQSAPAVVVNREFAIKMFGSVTNVLGRYYKLQDGSGMRVVGVVEDGKYVSLTEHSEPAIFPSFLRSPDGQSDLVVRSTRDPQQIVAAIRSKIHDLDSGLPLDSATPDSQLEVVLFPARMATLSLGVLGIRGAILSITGVFGMAPYSVGKRLRELGICMALGGQRKEVLQGVVPAMALLGLLATWIPVRRALSVNPLILLREE